MRWKVNMLNVIFTMWTCLHVCVGVWKAGYIFIAGNKKRITRAREVRGNEIDFKVDPFEKIYILWADQETKINTLSPHFFDAICEIRFGRRENCRLQVYLPRKSVLFSLLNFSWSFSIVHKIYSKVKLKGNMEVDLNLKKITFLPFITRFLLPHSSSWLYCTTWACIENPFAARRRALESNNWDWM